MKPSSIVIEFTSPSGFNFCIVLDCTAVIVDFSLREDRVVENEDHITVHLLADSICDHEFQMAVQTTSSSTLLQGTSVRLSVAVAVRMYILYRNMICTRVCDQIWGCG